MCNILKKLRIFLFTLNIIYGININRKGEERVEPIKVKELPITYDIDKELLKLLADANQKYGEYKTYLYNLEFNPQYFLNSLILTESLKSTQIEGTQISQDEMYYLKYLKNDDSREIQNLKKVIEYAEGYIKEHKEINITFVNNLHKILLDSVRGSNKEPGHIRTMQNWIGPKGSSIERATFIPPVPEEVPILLDNLFKYMNNNFIDPTLINLAISHMQFETIHAYRDGNGRLGRALIAIQLALLTEGEPILFLSEIIELYKPSYYMYLNESRKGNVLGFIKFFLNCIIDQCNGYIIKLDSIREIYKNDLEKIKEIKGSSVYIIMPLILKHIVFTIKDMELETSLSRNTITNVIKKLVNLGILCEDNTIAKKAYKYTKVYNVFVD